jgi:hypothetical protein
MVLGDLNDYPMIAADILFEGAAVGLVDASGHARPLTSVDKFAGFCVRKEDNSLGIAAQRNARVRSRGRIVLPVTGAVITDIGQPVYALDDNDFTFSPVGSVFIGKVARFVSAAVVDVEFDAVNMADPYAGRVWELFSATATLTKVDTDAQTMTLLIAAVLTGQHLSVFNGGAFGTVAVNVDPNAADLIAGPDDTGGDGGIAVNTKATAKRGDFIELTQGGDEGWHVDKMRGIWTIA